MTTDSWTASVGHSKSKWTDSALSTPRQRLVNDTFARKRPVLYVLRACVCISNHGSSRE